MYRLAKNEFFQFELKNSWHFITILCRKESIIRNFDLLCNLLFVVKITPSFQNPFNLQKLNKQLTLQKYESVFISCKTDVNQKSENTF